MPAGRTTNARRSGSARPHHHARRGACSAPHRFAVKRPPLPAVGDVHLIHTVMFVNGDHAAQRPCVVVRAPRHDLDYITFIQRSTTPGSKAGVDHPGGFIPELDLDGRWVLEYQRSVRNDTFASAASPRLAVLDDEYLVPLLDAWENQ
jgi:hypothetical protein